MPEIDGFAVLDWIRSRPEPLDIPVAVLTATQDDDDEARALALGATAVFRKPTHIDELGDTVKQIVQRWIGRGEIIAAHIWEMG